MHLFYKPCWQNKPYQFSWDSSVLWSSVQFCCSITRVLRYLASTSPNTKSKKSSKQANTQEKYKPSPLSRCGFCNKICNFLQTLWGPTLTVQLRKIEKKSFYINPQLKETNELSTLHDKTYVFYDTWSYILLAAPGDDTVFAILLHKHKIGKHKKQKQKRQTKKTKLQPLQPSRYGFCIKICPFLQTLLTKQTLSVQLGQFSSVEFSSVLLCDYM